MIRSKDTGSLSGVTEENMKDIGKTESKMAGESTQTKKESKE